MSEEFFIKTSALERARFADAFGAARAYARAHGIHRYVSYVLPVLSVTLKLAPGLLDFTGDATLWLSRASSAIFLAWLCSLGHVHGTRLYGEQCLCDYRKFVLRMRLVG